MAENSKPCCVEGCNRITTPESARGMCSVHYQRWRKHGDPLFTLLVRGNTGKPCPVEGCGAPITAKGFCAKHYSKLRLYGDPLGGDPRHKAKMRWIDEHASYEGDDCLPWPFSVNDAGRGMAWSPSRRKVDERAERDVRGGAWVRANTRA